MEQKYKDLLLKDLCGRIPYGVKIQGIDPDGEIVIEELITISSCFDCNMIELSSIKPYLFPLSSMTEEQKKEMDRMFELDMGVAVNCISNGTPNVVSGLNRLDWLNKHHFDYRGLIEQGLAIDATGLNIY